MPHVPGFLYQVFWLNTNFQQTKCEQTNVLIVAEHKAAIKHRNKDYSIVIVGVESIQKYPRGGNFKSLLFDMILLLSLYVWI